MIRTRVGYAGGTSANPTYNSLGDHTETVQVDFDPAVLTYAQLLEVFLASHDPSYSAPKRQYASAIFCHDEKQADAAREAISRWEATNGRKAATAILPLQQFYPAEDYHQKYYLQGDAQLAGELREIYPDFAAFVDSTVAARLNAYLYGCGTRRQVEAELDKLGLSEAGRARVRRLALE